MGVFPFRTYLIRNRVAKQNGVVCKATALVPRRRRSLIHQSPQQRCERMVVLFRPIREAKHGGVIAVGNGAGEGTDSRVFFRVLSRPTFLGVAKHTGVVSGESHK